MTGDTITVDCLQGFGEVDRERWEALWRQDPRATFYQKYDWYAAWLRHFAPGERAMVLIARQGEHWLGAAALIARQQGPRPLFSRKALTFISSFSEAYPLYQGPIIEPAREVEVIEALARAIIGLRGGLRGFCAVNFELYAPGSPAETLLWAVARASGKAPMQKVATQAHLIEWTGDYESYLASLGARTRRNVRAASRAFFESKKDPALHVAADVEGIGELVDSIREQKRRRFLSRGERSNFDRDCFADFLMDLVPRAFKSGDTLGLTARLGGEIIGAQLVFHDTHGHCFSYNSSFDDGHDQLRVHYLLESERVRLALDHGYKTIDLSTGHDDHKRHWTAGRTRSLLEGEVVLRPLGNLRHGAFQWLRKAVKARRS